MHIEDQKRPASDAGQNQAFIGKVTVRPNKTSARCCSNKSLIFNRRLKLTTVGDHNLGADGTRARAQLFDASNDIHSLGDFSKYYMLFVKPRGLCGANKKLGAVGIGSGICHGKDARASVFQLEVFVLKLFAINGFTASAIAFSKVATLTHEVWDNAVKTGALV